jgi:hypothetical protein
MAAAEVNDQPVPARILVCAQSNAAIDELLARIARRGLLTAEGTRRPAAIVRLGKVCCLNGCVAYIFLRVSVRCYYMSQYADPLIIVSD